MKRYGFKIFTDLKPTNPYGQKYLGPIFANDGINIVHEGFINDPYKNVITDEDKWFSYLNNGEKKRGFSYTGIPYRIDPNFITERNFFTKAEPYDIDDIRSLFLKDKAAGIKALAEYIAANDKNTPLSLENILNGYEIHYDKPLYAIEADDIIDDDIDINSINGDDETIDMNRDSLAEYQASKIRPVKLLSLDYYGKKALDEDKLNIGALEKELQLYKNNKLSFEKFNRFYALEQMKNFIKEHRGQIGSDHIIKAIKRRF